QPLVGAAPPLSPVVVSAGAETGSNSDDDVATSVHASAPQANTTRAMRPRAMQRARILRLSAPMPAIAIVTAGALVAAVLRMHGQAPPAELPAAPTAGPLELRVSHVRRVTFGDGCEEFPSFLPDGRALLYDGDDGKGNYVIHRLDLDEGATPRVIVHQDDPGWDMAPNV